MSLTSPTNILILATIRRHVWFNQVSVVYISMQRLLQQFLCILKIISLIPCIICVVIFLALSEEFQCFNLPFLLYPVSDNDSDWDIRRIGEHGTSWSFPEDSKRCNIVYFTEDPLISDQTTGFVWDRLNLSLDDFREYKIGEEARPMYM